MIQTLDNLKAICVTEHWKSFEQLQNHNIKGFHIASAFCRSEFKHGGSAIYLKKGIKYQERKDIFKLSIEKIMEIASVDMKIGTKIITLISLYTTPGETKKFLKKFEELLQMICWENKTVIIAGDFNINLLDKSNKSTIQFLDLLDSYGIKASINEPTRSTLYSKSCIDNILINQQNFTAELIKTNISDHDTAQMITIKEQIHQSQKYQYKRIVTSNHLQNLAESLKLLDWNVLYNIPDELVEEQWNTFTNLFKNKLDQACPMRKMKVATKKTPKPRSEEIINCKTRLDLLHVCKTFNHAFMKSYKEVKKEYDELLRKDKSNKFKQHILNSDNKMKTLWKTVATIKNNSSKEIPENPTEMAQKFNLHFATAAEEKISHQKNIPFQHDLERNDNKFNFHPITKEETLKLIGRLKNKNSSGIDDIPMKTVKFCMEEIATPLTYLINNSMKYGVFPELLKQALIKPIYKKGEEDKPESYRPISILPTFSKILELAICEQLVTFLMQEKILKSSQHGYVKGKSTTTAAFEFIQNVLNGLEDSKVVIALLLDLSKAFDTLTHDYLLTKMEYYGIRDTEKEWFRSYLSNRKQRVAIDVNGTRTISEEACIQLGVPQGSILGPILFIIFINDLYNKVEHHMINYADDFNLTLSASSFPEISNIVQSTLEQTMQWFQSNRLCMNVEKTCAILLKTAHSGFVTPSQIKLNNNKVVLQNSGRFLGLTIDENLNWSEHISSLCTKLASICYSLGVLRRYLDLSSIKIIYQATFESKLRYGIVFYGSGNTMDRVLKMQKRAVRTIMRMKSRESCRGIFRKNCLLTAIAVHIQECLIFVFKNKNYFQSKTTTSYNTRTTKLKYPQHRLTLTEKGPEYSCIRYYNKIIDYTEETTTLKRFKKQIFKLLIQIEPYTVEEFLMYDVRSWNRTSNQ